MSTNDISSANKDGFLCNDISELFSFFDSNLNALSTDDSTTSHNEKDNLENQSNTRQVISHNGNAERECTVKNIDTPIKSSDNGQQIWLKSSGNFPLSTTLADVILDLDIGSTVGSITGVDIYITPIIINGAYIIRLRGKSRISNLNASFLLSNYMLNNLD